MTLTLPSSPVHCPTEHAPSPTVHPSFRHFGEEEPKAQRRVHLTQVTQPLSDMTGVWPRACVLPKTAYVCWKVPKLRLCGSSAGCPHYQAPAVRLNPDSQSTLGASLAAFHGALNLPSLPPTGSPVNWECLTCWQEGDGSGCPVTDDLFILGNIGPC